MMDYNTFKDKFIAGAIRVNRDHVTHSEFYYYNEEVYMDISDNRTGSSCNRQRAYMQIGGLYDRIRRNPLNYSIVTNYHSKRCV